ncbi:polyadenylate-binding protein RBP47B' isoform X6 [Selaginella moellendorffii]|uniref:polyadenylate-binding protein RBP47B' isoform X6 n=1 Tax=Selaginella moellendorffii TaxID=88036 RepID=UPI000D1C948A|nr:polyadenylate-binding protein RBP47B' isoform X6 [Selaginella moellendorffii]|eukprot:XP_024538668.1 polyadenylate-binding protein RBP47B' isoform X6 [Selaginella moellendorffii]
MLRAKLEFSSIDYLLGLLPFCWLFRAFILESVLRVQGAAMAAAEAQQQQWQQQFGSHHHPMTLEEVRTLWIGDLQYWMDENYLRNLFAHTGEVLSAKVIRNKQTGYPEGYGFIEFNSHPAAERVLLAYNGTQMPQTEQAFRLNWASFGMGEKRMDGGPELSIFVGDLAPDVTDYMLHETFRTRFPSVRGAKVVIDAVTGRSKGYGFVRFADENERARAMSEMNGVYCSSRPMRISAATPKKAMAAGLTTVTAATIVPQPTIASPFKAATTTTTPTYQTMPYSITPPPSLSIQSQVLPPDSDPTNTTIFVGGLDLNITEEEVKQTFSQIGELVSVKIPPGKGCAFVQYAQRNSAEDALQRLHGTVIGQQAIRLSWGRSPTSTKQQAPTSPWGDAAQTQWNSYYGYQGYEGYAYTPGQEGYSAYYTPYHQIDGQYDEIFDPLAPPDIDRLNAAYMSMRESALLGRHLWLRTSDQVQTLA